MKLLTISIAAYNVERYLEKTLESLVVDEKLQEYLEVIIVNDGSKDGTKKMAEKYVSGYPAVFKLIDKPNGGYGSTINASISVSEGRYFKQLDGDDWFIKENLESLLLFLKSCTSDLVITPFIKCYESGKKEYIDDVPFLEDGIESSISLLNQASILAMHELAIKTEILRNNDIRIIEHCFYTDNEYTFYPLLYAETVVKFNLPVYCYRLGLSGQSVSIEGIKKHYKDIAVVASALYERWASLSSVSCRNLLSYKLRDITDAVYTYYLIGGGEEAKKELLSFDKTLKKKYKDVYKLSNQTRKIKLLRLSHFILYKFVMNIIVSKWENLEKVN